MAGTTFTGSGKQVREDLQTLLSLSHCFVGNIRAGTLRRDFIRIAFDAEFHQRF